MTDLISKAATGDEKAMKSVLDAYRPLINQECLSVLRKKPALLSHSEDLMGEGIEIVIRYLQKIDVIDAETFSLELGKRLHTELGRAAKSYSNPKEDVLPLGLECDFDDEEAPDLSEVAHHRFLTRAFSQATKMLPAKQKKAIVLYYYMGMTQQEAADALGIKQAGLCRRLERARKQILDNLMSLGIDRESLL